MQRIVMLLIVTRIANAAPSRSDARAEFDRGVAAYTLGNYDEAAAALQNSFELQADPETLFAWAQSERKRANCAKAVELYNKMLALNLGEANRREVTSHIDECTASQPKQAPPPPPPAEAERRAWWKDPVGGVLVGLGVAGAGVGTVFLVQAHDAKQQRSSALTYSQYNALYDRATTRGEWGIAATAAGGALVVAGIVWYAARTQPRTRVAGWVTPSSGGIAIAGGF